MIATISINKAKFFAYHGVLPQERTVGGEFEVDLTVDADVTRAAEADQLDGTIDYSALYGIISREMEVPSQLLEHVAARIANAVKAEFPQIREGLVVIRKMNPPFKAQLESVEVAICF